MPKCKGKNGMWRKSIQVTDEVLELISMEKDNPLIKVYAGKVTNLSV